MAQWTDITDSRLEPGKPIRSIEGLALRDNPIAIAEGAEDAPRIQTAAFDRPAAGDIIVASLGGRPATSIVPVGSVDYGVPRVIVVAGEIRVTAYAAPGSGQVFSIQKNGINVATRTSPGSISVDIQVLPGDIIRYQAYASDLAALFLVLEAYIRSNKLNVVAL